MRTMTVGFTVSLLLLLVLPGVNPVAGAQADDTFPPTIIAFTADLDVITVDEAEAGDTPLTLSWYTVGVGETHRLLLQVYDIDTWATYLLDPDVYDSDTGTLPPIGEQTVMIEHPVGFGLPSYRLVIVDGHGAVIDAHILTIPYAVPEADAAPPSIQEFSADVESLDIEALRRGPAQIAVSWKVTNRTATSNLIFEQVPADGPAVSAEQPRDHLWVASEGQGAVIVLLPTSTNAPITLRLRVVDMLDGALLDTQLVTLDVDMANLARIASFTAATNAVDAAALSQGDARVTVSWEVVNRPDGSNLVFEQVLPSGDTVSVELPRAALMVPSAGEGVVAPVLPPGDEDSITLRLRLVDITGARVHDEATLELQVTPSLPTAAPVTPTPSTASADLEIISFNVTPATIERGGTVTLNWRVRGAESITLWEINPVGQYTSSHTTLPATGSISIQVPEGYPNFASFQLYAMNAQGGHAETSVRVEVICPYTYFFTPPDTELSCPVGEAASVQAAFQAFEGGYMVWRSDSEQIYVLATRSYPRLGRYRDTWTEGDVIDIGDDTPPAGLYQPERGFGKVWADNQSVRDALGWATTLEQGYIMQIQTASSYRYANTYFTWPIDARVIAIVENTWQFVDAE